MNLRFTNRWWKPMLAGTIAAGAIALFTAIRLGSSAEPTLGGDSSVPVVFADVRHVIDRRCTACHSGQPSDLTFGAAPGGVTFDTPEQIVARASRIHERAVVTRTMPPANKTKMTDAERALLSRWISQGPPLRPRQ